MNREHMDFKPISPESAEHYTWGGNCDGWYLLRESGIHVIQERMPPGATEVLHLHYHSRQLFYVLRGTLRVANPSSSVAIPAGYAVVIEPNIPHRATNDSTELVEFLVISCPPSHGDRLDCEKG